MRDVWSERKQVSRSEYTVKRNFGYGMGSINTRNTSPEFDISKHIHKKPSKNVKTKTVQYEPKVGYTYDTIEDFDNKGSLGIILEFTGIRFLEGIFLRDSNSRHRQNSITYHTNVIYRNQNAFLRLSTIDDILEVEIADKKEPDVLFHDEIYVEGLLEYYDLSSMKALQKNGLVVVSYGKINEVDLHDENYNIKNRNSFTIKTEEDIETLIERIERNALASGINFQGDMISGSFDGKSISGKYIINGQEITIYIDKKPSFITTDFIKEKLMNIL